MSSKSVIGGGLSDDDEDGNLGQSHFIPRALQRN
jgi:hypothetical protein